MTALLRNRLPLLAILLVATVFMNGCGFSVRGQIPIVPFKAIMIEGNQGTAHELRQLLQQQPGLRFASKTTDAQVVLTVLSQTVERTVVAFSAAGRPREIQLRMRVTYKVNDGYAAELVGLQDIVQTRDLSISEAEVLASGNAEAFIIEDMQRDIAQQLARRLKAIRLPG
jgi:LPS-assembly lipoprotein